MSVSINLCCFFAEFPTNSPAFHTSSVNKYEGASSIQAIYKMKDVREPRALSVLHPLRQTSVNSPCGANNGGCAQLCVVTALPSGGLAYRCACALAHRLASDLQSCERLDEFLMYSQQRFIKGKVHFDRNRYIARTLLLEASNNLMTNGLHTCRC